MNALHTLHHLGKEKRREGGRSARCVVHKVIPESGNSADVEGAGEEAEAATFSAEL